VFRAVTKTAFEQVGGFDQTGYDDDTTLAPKLKTKALYTPALCTHINPESAHEIYRHGTWGGKSIARKHGPKMLISFSPPLNFLTALREIIRKRDPFFGLYSLVYRTGVFVGGLHYFLSGGRALGK
jgi:hypothetical protein